MNIYKLHQSRTIPHKNTR